MEAITVNSGLEKRFIFSEIIDLKKQGLIGESEMKKALRFVSNLRNKSNNEVHERNCYEVPDYYNIDGKDIERKAINVIVQID